VKRPTIATVQAGHASDLAVADASTPATYAIPPEVDIGLQRNNGSRDYVVRASAPLQDDGQLHTLGLQTFAVRGS
jgi:hypothetical protein